MERGVNLLEVSICGADGNVQDEIEGFVEGSVVSTGDGPRIKLFYYQQRHGTYSPKEILGIPTGIDPLTLIPEK